MRKQGCMASTDGSGSGSALEEHLFQATPVEVMPAPFHIRPRPGWLRRGGKGDRGAVDRDREPTLGLLGPPAFFILWLHTVSERLWTAPHWFSWLPRFLRGASGPRPSRGQLPGQGLLPKELNLHPCPTVACWCGAAQGHCLGIKIKPTIAASTQCHRALLEGNYRWPEMVSSAHSPELGRSRVHRVAGSHCFPHLALPQAFRIRAS